MSDKTKTQIELAEDALENIPTVLLSSATALEVAKVRASLALAEQVKRFVDLMTDQTKRGGAFNR